MSVVPEWGYHKFFFLNHLEVDNYKCVIFTIVHRSNLIVVSLLVDLDLVE